MADAIIQARMGSTRLPGKVMMLIRGKPLLYYVINQMKHSTKLSKLIVATTEMEIDNKIVEYVSSLGFEVYRGASEDVLDRYYKCAKKYQFNVIVRVTSDCPLIDPGLIDKCVNTFEENDFDYLSNVNTTKDGRWVYDVCGFPLGFGVGVFNFDAVEKAWRYAKKPSE